MGCAGVPVPVAAAAASSLVVVVIVIVVTQRGGSERPEMYILVNLHKHSWKAMERR